MAGSPARAAHGSLTVDMVTRAGDGLDRMRTDRPSRAERDAAKALREARHQALLRANPATTDDARLSAASLRRSGRRIAGVLSTACPVHECDGEVGAYCFHRGVRGFHRERWAASMELVALGSAS